MWSFHLGFMYNSDSPIDVLTMLVILLNCCYWEHRLHYASLSLPTSELY